MGFLDNSSITVDAILTKIGRKRISDGSFKGSRKFSTSFISRISVALASNLF